MSITGQQLVNDAFAAAGIYGAGETPTNDDAQLALRRLNRLIESWGNEAPLMYELAQDTFSTVAGTASYSSSLLASAVRPLAVDSCYLTLASVDYPVELIDNQTYQNFRYKTASGVPQYVYADPGMPTWTFSFYPAPYAVFTATMVVRRLLAASAITLATTVSLPPGYELAIVDSLAVDIAPTWGAQPNPVTVDSATKARAVLKRQNYVPLLMDSGLGLPAQQTNKIFEG